MIVDLETLKLYNKDNADTAYDSIYTLFLEEAEDIVLDYLGYNPTQSDRIATLSGLGLAHIKLDAKPINTIASITIDGVSYDTVLFHVNEEYLIKTNGDKVFSCGTNNIMVSYNGGFSTIPAGIKKAILKIASISLTEMGKIGITSINDTITGSRTFVRPEIKNCLLPISQYSIKGYDL